MRLPGILGGVALAVALAGAAHAESSVNITASYEARLLVKVADLRTDQVATSGAYRLGARLTTIGALGVLKPSTLLVQANGNLSRAGPQPQIFIQTERNGEKRRVTRYSGGPADPLTVLLRATLQAEDASPCIGAAPVFDGRQRYELVLSPTGGGIAKYNLVRPAACRLAFHPISGFSKGPPKANPFLRGDPVASFAFEPRAKVWVMTEISVPTAVGSAHIALTGLHIDGARPTPAAVRPLPQKRIPGRPRRR